MFNVILKFIFFSWQPCNIFTSFSGLEFEEGGRTSIFLQVLKIEFF